MANSLPRFSKLSTSILLATMAVAMGQTATAAVVG